MSYDEVYRMPIQYRLWFINRLVKKFNDEAEKIKNNHTSKNATQTNGLNDYQDMLDKKFGIK